MIIYNKGLGYAVNFDNIKMIQVQFGNIYVFTKDGGVLNIGEYETDDRAKQVLSLIINHMEANYYVLPEN